MKKYINLGLPGLKVHILITISEFRSGVWGGVMNVWGARVRDSICWLEKQNVVSLNSQKSHILNEHLEMYSFLCVTLGHQKSHQILPM